MRDTRGQTTTAIPKPNETDIVSANVLADQHHGNRQMEENRQGEKDRREFHTLTIRP